MILMACSVFNASFDIWRMHEWFITWMCAFVNYGKYNQLKPWNQFFNALTSFWAKFQAWFKKIEPFNSSNWIKKLCFVTFTIQLIVFCFTTKFNISDLIATKINIIRFFCYEIYSNQWMQASEPNRLLNFNWIAISTI